LADTQKEDNAILQRSLYLLRYALLVNGARGKVSATEMGSTRWRFRAVEEP